LKIIGYFILNASFSSFNFLAIIKVVCAIISEIIHRYFTVAYPVNLTLKFNSQFANICLLIIFLIKTYFMATGVLGDVKYSILNPQKFIKLNGNSWVLMDGRNINNSDLFKETGMTMLPDARGVFLRSMNVGRDTTQGDPDGNTRLAGSYQGDEVKAHTHQYSDAYYAEYIGGNQGLAGNKGDWDYDNGRIANMQTTQPSGIAESRPRNICVFVYIKIMIKDDSSQ
jgi:hypothetical protein